MLVTSQYRSFQNNVSQPHPTFQSKLPLQKSSDEQRNHSIHLQICQNLAQASPVQTKPNDHVQLIKHSTFIYKEYPIEIETEDDLVFIGQVAELNLLYYYQNQTLEFVVYGQPNQLDPNYVFNSSNKDCKYTLSNIHFNSNVRQIAIAKLQSTWIMAVGCEFTLEIFGFVLINGSIQRIQTSYDDIITVEGNLIQALKIQDSIISYFDRNRLELLIFSDDGYWTKLQEDQQVITQFYNNIKMKVQRQNNFADRIEIDSANQHIYCLINFITSSNDELKITKQIIKQYEYTSNKLKLLNELESTWIIQQIQKNQNDKITFDKIISIHLMENDEYKLVVVTSNGYRVYLNLASQNTIIIHPNQIEVNNQLCPFSNNRALSIRYITNQSTYEIEEAILKEPSTVMLTKYEEQLYLLAYQQQSINKLNQTLNQSIITLNSYQILDIVKLGKSNPKMTQFSIDQTELKYSYPIPIPIYKVYHDNNVTALLQLRQIDILLQIIRITPSQYIRINLNNQLWPLDQLIQSYGPVEIASMLFHLITDKEDNYFFNVQYEEKIQIQIKSFIKDYFKANINIEQTPNWVVGNAYTLIVSQENREKCVALLSELNYSQLWNTKSFTKVDQKSAKVKGLTLYLSQILKPIWNLQLWNKDSFCGCTNNKIINYNLEDIKNLEQRLTDLAQGIRLNPQLFHSQNQNDTKIIESQNIDENLRQENKIMSDILEYIDRIRYLLKFLLWLGEQNLRAILDPIKHNQKLFEVKFHELCQTGNENVQNVLRDMLQSSWSQKVNRFCHEAEIFSKNELTVFSILKQMNQIKEHILTQSQKKDGTGGILKQIVQFFTGLNKQPISLYVQTKDIQDSFNDLFSQLLAVNIQHNIISKYIKETLLQLQVYDKLVQLLVTNMEQNKQQSDVFENEICLAFKNLLQYKNESNKSLTTEQIQLQLDNMVLSIRNVLNENLHKSIIELLYNHKQTQLLINLNSPYLNKCVFFKKHIDQLQLAYQVYFPNKSSNPELAIKAAYELSMIKCEIEDYNQGYILGYRYEIISNAQAIATQYYDKIDSKKWATLVQESKLQIKLQDLILQYLESLQNIDYENEYLQLKCEIFQLEQLQRFCQQNSIWHLQIIAFDYCSACNKQHWNQEILWEYYKELFKSQYDFNAEWPTPCIQSQLNVIYTNLKDQMNFPLAKIIEYVEEINSIHPPFKQFLEIYANQGYDGKRVSETIDSGPFWLIYLFVRKLQVDQNIIIQQYFQQFFKSVQLEIKVKYYFLCANFFLLKLIISDAAAEMKHTKKSQSMQILRLNKSYIEKFFTDSQQLRLSDEISMQIYQKMKEELKNLHNWYLDLMREVNQFL